MPFDQFIFYRPWDIHPAFLPYKANNYGLCSANVITIMDYDP